MKKLMVAGCSFSAVSNHLPGTSWSEILAKRLGWQVVNLARQGCSNGGVRIMIEEIRRQRPDFAIVTPTFWDRMEIPAKAAPFDWSQGPSIGWNPPLERHLQNRERKNGYNRDDGINNVNYGNNPNNMICETIFMLAENHTHPPYRPQKIDKIAQMAVKHYIDAIYDANWKQQMDQWIITEGVLQMFHDGLNFIVSPALLWPWSVENQTQWRDAFPAVIPDQYIMQNSLESVLSVSGSYPFEGEDPGYHTSQEGQEKIADNYYRRITQDFNITV